MIIRETVKVGDCLITLETGRIAKQAGGSVLVTCGETVVLVTACGTEEGRPGQSFLPLTVDYQEKTYAAGKIPGGFFKREGRLREHEVLTSRLIDRPCRPLFPSEWRGEIQVIATVMSSDNQNAADVLAMCGASAALMLCKTPYAGPIAGVRVGRVDGKLIANPTYDELAKSDFELLIAASKNAIVMVEGEANEVVEADLIEAIMYGHQCVQGILDLQVQMQEAAGQTKWVFDPPKRDPAVDAAVKTHALAAIKAACNEHEKFPRYDALSDAKRAAKKALSEQFESSDISEAFGDLKYNTMRAQVLDEKRRVDGRDFKTVRPIAIEAGLLPRVHGSSLFTRGETQAIVTATLGTNSDEQKIDGLLDPVWKNFMLHYNFPPYSVGEARFMRGPGRREIGHGNLAERAIKGLLPNKEDFPYTIRIVSEITESNGSSSMASVCGGSLALMDAGVPIKKPVAGVAMGLIKEGDKYAILTDILGDEDHLGDMDFKVCGTDKGITAIQMDIKIAGLPRSIMEEALAQARDGRLHILNEMNKALAAPREELSKYAPRITAIKVKPDQIRTIIGPGGKMIKAITEQTGAQINVSDDGTVAISSSDPEAVKKAIAFILGLTTEPEVGATYKGTVRRIERYGAFLEIAPGKDGLLHITDMSYEFVDKVEDLMNMGDEIEVVVSNIDREGRVKLSRKPLLEKPEGYVEPEPRERSDRGDRGDRGPRRDGGGRGRDGGRGPRREGGDRGPRREGGDRGPRREGGDRGPRREGGDRPPREGGDRPAREGGDRPPREGGERSAAPRQEGEDGDRPRRRRRRRPEGDSSSSSES